MGEAPDPILPDQSTWPVVWLVALTLAVIPTVVHAVRRQRLGWTAAIILAVPLALPAYWVIEVLRVPEPSGGVETTSSLI